MVTGRIKLLLRVKALLLLHPALMKTFMFPARKTATLFIVPAIITCMAGCRDNKPKVTPGPVLYKKDTAAVAGKVKMKAPIINIIDTVTLKQTILVVKDSASSSQAVG